MSKKRTIDLSQQNNIPQNTTGKKTIDASGSVPERVETDRTSLLPSKLGEYQLDSQYDKGIVSGLDQPTYRAENQGGVSEFTNALSKAVLKTPLNIVSNVAAIGDIEDWNNTDQEIGNWLSRAMQEGSKYLDENLPVYQGSRDAAKYREWVNQNVVSDLTSSAAGFVGTGYLTGAAIGQLANLSRLLGGTRAVQSSNNLKNLVNALGMTGPEGQKAAQLLNAYALNHAEGITTAMNVYDDTKEAYLETHPEDIDGAEKKATEAAETTLAITRLNVVTNITSAGAFMRSPKLSRQLLQDISKKNTLKTMLSEAGQEFAEEEIGLVAEKAGMAVGQDKSYSIDNALDDIFSSEGLEAGFLGAIGGAGQTGLTALVNQLSGKTEEQRKRFFEQQAQNNVLDALASANNLPTVSNSFASAKQSAEQLNKLQEAIKAGDDKTANDIRNTLLENQAFNAFDNGVAEKLIQTYNDFAKLTPEQAKEKGLDINPNSPDYYPLKAREAVRKINEMENIYNSIPDGLNKKAVFDNVIRNKNLNTRLSELSGEIAKAEMDNTAEKSNLGIDDNSPLVDKLQSTKTLNDLKDEQSKLRGDLIENLNESEELQTNPVDKTEPIDPTKLQEEIDKTELTNAARFVQENSEGFDKMEDLFNALKTLPSKTRKDVMNNYRNLVFDTIKRDEEIPEELQIHNGKEVRSKAIPQGFNIYGPVSSPHTHLDLESNTAFTPEVTEEEQEEVKDKVDQATEIKPIPVNAKKYIKGDRERTTSVNTEFKYRTYKINGEDYFEPLLENDIPIVNEKEKEVFNPNFKYISDPNNLNNGTEAELRLQDTSKIEFIPGTLYGEESLVLYQNGETIGKLKKIGEYKTLLELAKKGPVKVTITGKWGSSTVHSEKTQYSLNEYQMSSPQNLPNGEVVIGTIQNDQIILPEKYKDLSINIANKVNGQNFMLFVTPEGNYYSEILFNTPIKDIKIGDKSVYKIIENAKRKFQNELDVIPVADRKFRLLEMQQKWDNYKAKNIDPLVNLSQKNYKLRVNLDRDNNWGFYISKGRGVKAINDTKEVAKELQSRFFNVNSKLLETNQPFSYQGQNYESYVDFLVKNNILTSTLYPKRPFAFTNIDISLPVEQAIEQGIETQGTVAEIQTTPVDNEKAEKLRRLQELRARGGATKDVLTRPIQMEAPYEVWDAEIEMEWMSRNLPNVPVEILDSTLSILDRLGVNAYGAFHQGIVYMANNSEIGTLYHEAYHAVYNNYLTPKQQEVINKQSGLTEEQQAEAFRDYILSSENVKPKSNALLNFFKDIYFWITDKLGITTLHQLFDRIDRGKFATFNNTSNVSRLRTIPTFNAVEQKQRVDSITFGIFNRLSLLQNVEGIINIDFQNITKNDIDNAFAEEHEMWTLEQDINALEGRQKVLDNWDKFKELTLKNFEKFGLVIRPESTEDLDQENETEREESGNTKERIYDKPFFESSIKESIGREVKIFLSTVAWVDEETAKDKYESGNFDYREDELENKLFLDFNETFNYLSENLVGLESIDEMIERIEELSLVKPKYYKIAYELKKTASQQGTGVNAEDFRHKFFTTMSNQYIDFLTISKNADTKEYINNGEVEKSTNYYFNPYETNKRTLQRQIVSDWAFSYQPPKSKNEEKYNEFRKIIDKEYTKELNNPKSTEGLDIIANYLNGIGLPMSVEGLSAMKNAYFKSNPNGKFTDYLGNTGSPSVAAILKAHYSGVNVFSGIEEQDTKGERAAINKLAQYEKLVSATKADPTFLNGQNKMVYAVNSNNYASKLVHRLRNNRDGIVDKLLAAPINRNNKILKDIKRNPDEFKRYVFDTMYDNTDSKGGEGISYDQLDPITALTTKINLFFNRGNRYGYFFSPTPADRGNSDVFKLLKFSKNDVVFSGENLNKESDFYKWLVGAVESEYLRIKQTYEEFDGESPIKNYHGTKDKKGNAYFFNQFWKLNDIFRLKTFYANNQPLPDFNPDSEGLYKALNESFKEQFKVEKQKLAEAGVIELDEKGKVKGRTEVTATSFDNGFKVDEHNIINYIANNIYTNTELTKILSGDLAYYKGNPHTEKDREVQLADMNKRFGQSFVPGRDLSKSTEKYSNGAKETFNLAIAPDNEYRSAYVTEYARAIYNSLIDPDEVNFETLFDKEGDFNPTEIYLREMLGGYLKVNQTDAQGFITLDRYADILRGQGQYNGKLKEVIERLKNGGTSIEDFHTVLQPIKGFYYNQELKRGLAIPTQVKYSTVPLIPAFVNNYPVLRDLLDKMEKSGVDEYVFESGIKAGEYNKNAANSEELNYITLDNANWRIPQIVPYKDKIHENFGSQIRKLVIANIDDEALYNGITGKELKARYQELIKQNVKEGYDKLIPKFEDVESVVEMLRDQIASGTRALPDFYDTSLQVILDKFGNKDTRIPLDQPLIKRRIENILNSMFDKNVIKQKMAGFAAVQVSSYGVAKTSEDLKFVRMEDGVVKPAEVLVSPQYFLNALAKKGIDVSTVDLNNIPEELLKIVLYRIPTQGKNSMLPAIIKGFLPVEAGSTIILPAEITTQAGSDYDIDKVYIEMYNFNKDMSKTVKGLEGRQNEILDIHYSILTSPNSFAELVTPNGTTNLKKIRDEIASKVIKDKSPKFWHNVWVQEDMRAKNQAGKQLVGVYSIQSTAHAIAQELGMNLTVPVLFEGKENTSLSEKYNIYGKLISDDISERQSAAVDNAKEPLPGDLNDNTFTSPVISLIIRAGYGNEIASWFVRQPIIMDLTKEYYKYESSTSKSKALKAALNSIEKTYNNKPLDKAENINLQFLKDNINNKEKGSEANAKILSAFLRYKQIGDELSTVSNSLSIDTKGTQATIAENLSNLDNLEKAKNSEFIQFAVEAYNNHSLHSFEKYGVEEAMNHIQKYIALDTSVLMRGKLDEEGKGYNGILARFETIKGDKLTADEINKVTYEFYTYLYTLKDSNFSKITNGYKKNLLSGENSLAKKLKNYIASKKESGEELNSFIKELKFDNNADLNFDLIKYNNTRSLSTEEKTDLSEALQDMFDGDVEDHKLAKDLVVYSFITSGFTRTVDSFIDLIPPTIYESLDLINFYRDIRPSFNAPIQGDDVFNTGNFVDQYVQNNFRELQYVQKIYNNKKLIELENDPESAPKYVYDIRANKLLKFNGDKYQEINKLGYSNVFKEYSAIDNNLQSIHSKNNVVKKQKESVGEVSQKTVVTILDKLKDRFGLDYKLINDESLDYAGKVEDGKVVINLANVGLDTPFHEYAHPFVELIKQKNKELYSNLTRQIENTEDGKRILSKVKRLYPELSKEDQIEESIVQAIGEYAANNINPNTGKSLISAIRTLIDRIGKYIKQLFNKEFTIYAENLNVNTTLEQLGMYMSVGESKFGVSSVKDIENEFGLRTHSGGYRAFSNVGIIKKQIESKYPNVDISLRKDGGKSIVVLRDKDKFQKVDKLGKILEKIKDNLNRQISIYKNTTNKKTAIEKLEKLSKQLQTLEEAEAINTFINEAEYYTSKAGKVIAKLDPKKGKESIKSLVEIYDYISSYSVLDDIRNNMTDSILGMTSEEIEYSPIFKKLQNAITQRDLIKQKYFDEGIPLLADWLMEFAGDTNQRATEEGLSNLVITRDMMIEELKQSSKDISKFSAMFDPMITTNDAALALFAKAMKRSLEESRQKDIEAEYEFGEAYNKYLKESGLNPNDVAKFNSKLYEEVETYEGKRLAFVQEYKMSEYKANKRKFFEELGEKPDEFSLEFEKWNKKVATWYKENNKGNKPADKYLNPKWKILQADKVALNYYNFLTSKYLKAQERLPEGHRIGLYLPAVRKSTGEKIRQQGLVEGAKEIYKDNTKLQATDTQYGIQTQTGEKKKYLPVFYTNRIEPKDQSVDLLSSIMLFDSMSNKFEALSDIEAEVNLMKEVINNRTTLETNSKGETIIDALSKKFGIENYIKKQGTSNATERLNAFLDMVYYGEKTKKEELLGYDVGKITNSLNGITSTVALAGNVLQGFSNAAFGNVMVLAEAAGGQWYNKENWKNAQGRYFKEINSYFGDFDKISGKSKIGQIIDLYDPMQGSFASDYGVNVSGNVAKKLFKTDTLFFLQHAGEHQIQTTTLLALMDATMVDSKEGKIKLIDAYELKNGKLTLKEGVKWTKEQEQSLRNKVHGINKRLHGVYNDFDKASVQRYAIGRFGMLFRNWIVSGFRRRFQEAKADYELEDVVEGNYRTFFKILVEDIKNRQLPFLYSYNNLTNLQKQNIRRTMVEVITFVSAVSLSGLLMGELEDEEKGSTERKFLAFFAYQSKRLESEILFFVNPKDTFRVFEEPIASMSTVRKVAGFVDQLVFTWNPEDLEYKRRSGVHEKGDNKSWAKFKQLVPVLTKVESLTDPETAMKFFDK